MSFDAVSFIYLNPQLGLSSIEQAISFSNTPGLQSNLDAIPFTFNDTVFIFENREQINISSLNQIIKNAKILEGESPNNVEVSAEYHDTIGKPIFNYSNNAFAFQRPGDPVTFNISISNLQVGDSVRILRNNKDYLFATITSIIDPTRFTLSNSIYTFNDVNATYQLLGIKLYDISRLARIEYLRLTSSNNIVTSSFTTSNFNYELYTTLYPDARLMDPEVAYTDYKNYTGERIGNIYDLLSLLPISSNPPISLSNNAIIDDLTINKKLILDFDSNGGGRISLDGVDIYYITKDDRRISTDLSTFFDGLITERAIKTYVDRPYNTTATFCNIVINNIAQFSGFASFSNFRASNVYTNNSFTLSGYASNLQVLSNSVSNLFVQNSFLSNTFISNASILNVSASNAYTQSSYNSNAFILNTFASNIYNSNFYGSNIVTKLITGSNGNFIQSSHSNIYLSNSYTQKSFISNAEISNLYASFISSPLTQTFLSINSNLISQTISSINSYTSNNYNSNLFASNATVQNLAVSNAYLVNTFGSNASISNINILDGQISNIRIKTSFTSNSSNQTLSASNAFIQSLSFGTLNVPTLMPFSNIIANTIFAQSNVVTSLIGSNAQFSNLTVNKITSLNFGYSNIDTFDAKRISAIAFGVQASASNVLPSVSNNLPPNFIFNNLQVNNTLGVNGLTMIGTSNTVNNTQLVVKGLIEATNYNVTSDRKLKDNIHPLISTKCLEQICALNPVEFSYKDVHKNTTKKIGFIAQDIENVISTVTYKSKNYPIALNKTILFAFNKFFLIDHCLSVGDKLKINNIFHKVTSICDKDSFLVNYTFTDGEYVLEEIIFDSVKNVDSLQIIPLLVSSIQELKRQIDELKNKYCN